MKKSTLAALGFALAALGQTVSAAPSVAVAAAPTNARYEADLKELVSWMQVLTGRQTAMGNSMDRMWNAFDAQNRIAETGSPEEVQRSFEDVLVVIKQTQEELRAEKAEIVAIQPLKGNVVLAEIPPGHLAKLQSHAVKSADGFLQLTDRAETQVTAMALGEAELGKEFSLLMMDSSIEMISSQLNLLQSNGALMKKGSANAVKMESMTYVYEAIDHLLREQRKVSANEALGVNFLKVKQMAAKMRESSIRGTAALKKEKAELKTHRPYMSATLAASLDAQHSSYGQWFDYLMAKASTIDTFPDEVSTLDPYDPAVVPVSNVLIDMESKFLELHSQMLQQLAG